jgi:lipopolysaccharide/colanic/teichoic acid biosynthesis glycosyltransferase
MKPTTDSMEYTWIREFNPNKILLRGRAYLVAKRITDLTIVILTMPLWLPLLSLIAFAVLLSDPTAPVFFIQQRTGKGGRHFLMYKIRTMVKNAEDLKQEYAHLNKLQWPDFKIINDPRVTSIGRFLRKTRLDELPQLFNVLRGEMSLVGPRPTSFGAETYRLWHTARLDVLPGITGLWQIVRQDDSEFDERLRLDIMYIEKRSIWFDLQILIKTFMAFFRFLKSDTY